MIPNPLIFASPLFPIVLLIGGAITTFIIIKGQRPKIYLKGKVLTKEWVKIDKGRYELPAIKVTFESLGLNEPGTFTSIVPAEMWERIEIGEEESLEISRFISPDGSQHDDVKVLK